MSFEEERYKKFIKIIRNKGLNFQNEKFYYNNKIINNSNKNSFIDESKYKYITNKIIEAFKKLYVISKRSLEDIKEQVIKIIKNKNVEELKKYIKNNYISINELSYDHNNDSFDLLIFSIQSNSSLKIIEYIISLYSNLNYKEQDKTFNYQFFWNVPLYTAIANNRFDISNLLLKYGADINYEKNIIKFLYDKKFLNCENLIYILNNKNFISNAAASSNKDAFEIEWIKNKKKDFLEIYLKYFNWKDKLIKTEYYEESIKNNNIDSLIILYDNDNNDKNVIIYEIIKII
ncbi:hypothetical protein BCR36DRAFT_354652, partial [Piromyces finnis]